MEKAVSMKRFIKTIIIKILRILLIKSKEQIKQKIDEKDVISFDVFDTLIQRNVKKPEDIYNLTEKKYNVNSVLQISDYKKTRICAEKAARKNSLKEEVTLSEIYKMIDIDDPIRQCLMNMEREIEFASTFPKPKGRELYEYAVQEGKKIVIISDMYLDRKLIGRILEKNGYRGYCELFVSSEYGVKKKTGHLYDKVIAQMGYEPKQMLHIGDNPVSDGISAWRRKISFCIL